MIKLSVVVPVYNVEKYIAQCARSLFEQTLDDIEFLFIDDCTPDNSIEILKRVLEEYPDRKKYVTIHRMQKNSGTAKVREWGIKHALGEYIVNCDSDDYIDVSMYEVMYKRAKRDDLDMVVCNYYFFSNGISHVVNSKLCMSNNKHILLSDLLKGVFPSFLWNKMIKRTVYQTNIVWPFYSMWEDLVIMTQLIKNVKKYALIEDPLYYYRSNDSSLTRSFDKDKIIQKFEQIKGNVDIILNTINHEEYVDELVVLKINARYILTKDICNFNVWKVYRSCFQNLISDMLFCNQLPLKTKVREVLYTSFLFHRVAYHFISNRKKKS